MATPTKGQALRVWMQDEAMERLAKLSDATDMAQSGLAARLLSAALDAVAAEGYRLTLPLKFAISKEPPPPAPRK